MGTILGNPENIYCVGNFKAGSVTLDKKSSYEFIDLNWNTVVLSLKDLVITHAHYPPNIKMENSQSETDFPG